MGIELALSGRGRKNGFFSQRAGAREVSDAATAFLAEHWPEPIAFVDVKADVDAADITIALHPAAAPALLRVRGDAVSLEAVTTPGGPGLHAAVADLARA